MSGESFVWDAVSGRWNDASNWIDTTAGQDPATHPPGRYDHVTIDAAANGAITAISGSGSSASLTIGGPTLLDGWFGTRELLLRKRTALSLGSNAVARAKAARFGAEARVAGAGTLTISGASTASSLNLGGGVTLEQRGTWTETGTLTLSAAILRNDAGATFAIAGDFGITQGAKGTASLVNAGTLAKTEGDGVSYVDVNTVDTGTISVEGGNLRFAGASNSFQGTYIGPGMIDYGTGSTNALGTIDMIDGACSTNFGTVNQNGLLTMGDGSTLTNLESATWNFAGDVGILRGGNGASTTITNDGLLAKTAGTGTSEVDIDLVNYGTLDVETGTLGIDGPNNSVGGIVEGAGTLNFGAGTSTIDTPTMSVAALEISGGSVTLDNDFSYGGSFALSGSTTQLALDGRQLTLTGRTSFDAGTIVGMGGSAADTLSVSGSSVDLAALKFSSWSSDVDTIAIDGTAGADTLIGSSQADIVEGGAGNDVLTGSGGGDTFVYHAGWGQDTITAFAAGSGAGHDLIQFDQTLFSSFTDVMAHAIDSNGNVIITYDTKNTITLDGVGKSSLEAADFRFVGSTPNARSTAPSPSVAAIAQSLFESAFDRKAPADWGTRETAGPTTNAPQIAAEPHLRSMLPAS